jgi:CMP/dCMP kinase
LQQHMGSNKGIVMDGRDIGTVVFPNAELKIFMIADPEIRAKRRFLELSNKGQTVSMEEIRQNINQRDYIDQNREESPLRKADDAIVLDNSFLTPEQQLQWTIQQAKAIIEAQ